MSENLRRIVTESLVGELGRFVDRHWESKPFQKMGSEIERAFAASFLIGTQLSGHDTRLGMPEKPFKGWFLAPQFEIGKYRVDFLFGRGDRLGAGDCVAVECDGHDFHEKTRDQAARDKARDRYLNLHVKAVLRFTGREIYRDAGACVVEALHVLHRESGK